MNPKTLATAIAAFAVVCLSVESAHGQWFRNRMTRQFRPTTTWSQPRTVARPQTARPVTGYGTNLHRNFVIRQEQQRSAATGLPPRTRGNIYWAR